MYLNEYLYNFSVIVLIVIWNEDTQKLKTFETIRRSVEYLFCFHVILLTFQFNQELFDYGPHKTRKYIFLNFIYNCDYTIYTLFTL